MKKFFTLISVVAVAGAVSVASAADRSGKLALGFQESFTTGLNGPTTTNSLGAWSVKYGVSEMATAQFTFGFDYANKGGNDRVSFGARILYDLVENENSDFYTGIGFLYDIDKPNDTLRISIPLGFEWSFDGLPEVGFSAEAGLAYDYRVDTPKTSSISSVGGNVGGALGLGVHYYF